MDNCKTCDEFYYNESAKSWLYKVENGHWDYYKDGFDYIEIEVKYCFKCGRKLGEHRIKW
ncbi:hypothetical protein P5637_06815 [Bacillus paralicheniformis]|uniref:Zinc-ribbon domain-containing protein n=1 Tax=Bacillus paralicheniformis TaxID=1648923 RepID=A0ABY3FY35_9BACI|nr:MULTISPECIES: hypothetical protein [Bacillus subtilis group]KND05551.1 hypothetical protein ACJ43_20545 [Bacillus paralicheniformis]MCY9236261.1 hypothetical protein [Bacillus licheniformis]MED1237894.1 hypothetical protein [Bacillus paralicheniformis]TWL41688.1 hypothetical protein CHCC15381_3857 [Bacillus paralicheniformis]TWN88822.1 hypothetical protein CHCC20491_0194 [Bacillus paralicheniformis]